MNYYIKPSSFYFKNYGNTHSRREEMSERVMEIVLYIVDSIGATTDENIISEVKHLSNKLLERGYTENEINTAFSWLMENILEPVNIMNDEDIVQNRTSSQKQWTKLSQPKTVAIPYNFLYQLKELDIVGEEEIEQILGRSLLRGKKETSISEIKAIINELIFNQQDISSVSFFVMNRKYYGH